MPTGDPWDWQKKEKARNTESDSSPDQDLPPYLRKKKSSYANTTPLKIFT